MSVHLTEKARQDLSDLSDYGLAEWGAERSLAYFDDLLACLGRLAAQPGMGRARPEVLAGARSFPRGVHMIFYRVVDQGIEILAIPHQSADPGGYL